MKIQKNNDNVYVIISDNGEDIISTNDYTKIDIYPVISNQIIDAFINNEFNENFIDNDGNQLRIYRCKEELDLYWNKGFLYIPISHNGYISGIERKLPIFNYDGFVTTTALHSLRFEEFKI